MVRWLRENGHRVSMNEPFPDGTVPDIIVACTFGPLTLLKLWQYRNKYKAAVVHHGHTTVEDLLGGGFIPKFLNGLVPPYLKFLYSFSHIIIAPSFYARELHKKDGVKPPVRVVSNGIRFNEFYPDEGKRQKFRSWLESEWHLDVSKPVILNVGIIWDRKAPDTWYECAKRLPDYNFVWAGPEVKNRWVDKAKTLPNVVFTGFLPEIHEAYCGADVFFFPSREENQGIPLIEAAACKLPLVARPLGAYYWLKHEETALFGETTEELADCLRRAIEDQDLRYKLVEKGLQVAKDNHDYEPIAEMNFRIYQRAIKLKNICLDQYGVVGI
jgi:1,2-diacylglycerol-3-alpha-glucose alpha-1,2-glucosyltransferase